eukprot:357528-Chlamydomonas_euryale.AAC.1
MSTHAVSELVAPPPPLPLSRAGGALSYDACRRSLADGARSLPLSPPPLPAAWSAASSASIAGCSACSTALVNATPGAWPLATTAGSSAATTAGGAPRSAAPPAATSGDVSDSSRSRSMR